MILEILKAESIEETQIHNDCGECTDLDEVHHVFSETDLKEVSKKIESKINMKSFIKDFQILLQKHNAELEITVDQDYSGVQSAHIAVLLNDYTHFELTKNKFNQFLTKEDYYE